MQMISSVLGKCGALLKCRAGAAFWREFESEIK